MVLIVLAAAYTGHRWGLGRWWVRRPFVQRHRSSNNHRQNPSATALRSRTLRLLLPLDSGDSVEHVPAQRMAFVHQRMIEVVQRVAGHPDPPHDRLRS
jgi:hypothetical protein